MNKMKATRDFRHGRRPLKVGDEFEASQIDSEYYTKNNYAVASEVVPEEESKPGSYQRRDMRASATRVAETTKTPPRPRGRPKGVRISGPEKAPDVQVATAEAETPEASDKTTHTNS